MHPPGCVLRAHPDANTNEKIPWKESVTGRNTIRLKGHGVTLDIQQRYDGASDKMGPPIRWSLWMTQRYNFYEKTYLQEKIPIETR